MVAGPKGSGKSTFSRLLANTLLTAPKPLTIPSCFWLDLDPGQPEFCHPGQVSLSQLREPILGPPFTHPYAHPAGTFRNIRTHTLAAISPKEDPDHFLSCAFDLLSHYLRQSREFPGAPLIINCSGWIVGSAFSVLLDLVKRFPLTDFVLMQPMESEATQQLRTVLPAKAAFWTMSSRARPPQSRTSAEFRAMQSMSYFHSVRPADGRPAWDIRPLTHHAPWKVRYDGPNPGIHAISSYHEAIPPAMLSTILPGMIVAIVHTTSDAAFLAPGRSNQAMTLPPLNFANATEQDEDQDNVESRIHRTAEEALPYLTPAPSSNSISHPLDPKYSECLGLALIRGLDTTNRELHLLTPIPSATIRKLQDQFPDQEGSSTSGSRIVLVRGKFDCPDWAFLEDVHLNRALERQNGHEERDGTVLVAGTEGGDGIARPYVALRRPDAGLSGSVWRVRHLPRKFGGPG